MKNWLLITPIVVGLTTVSNAEIKIFISGDDQASISTDEKRNIDYIYIDKDSQIINSTIGTNISTSEPMDKEERIEYYKNRIHYYKDKIIHYQDKIKKYKEKIIDKPENRERYEGKIEGYQNKISAYKNRIKETQKKIEECQLKDFL